MTPDEMLLDFVGTPTGTFVVLADGVSLLEYKEAQYKTGRLWGMGTVRKVTADELADMKRALCA